MGTRLVQLVANLSGGTRRAWRKGKEFVVASAALINPGVLNGSKGALYYPPDECARNVFAWNGIPLTVNHPQDPVTAQFQSAADDGVWTRQGIGRVRNTVFGNKLRSEAWFDVERTRNADRRFGTNILQRLERGEPIELSTGLFTDNEVAPRGAVDEAGRPYDYVAKNYRPDHLAVLPNAVGACSVKDGCGINVNSGFDSDEQRQAFFGLLKAGKIEGEASEKGGAKTKEPWEMTREEHGKQFKDRGMEVAFVLPGSNDTFQHKDHLKAAGAEWDAGGNRWIVPSTSTGKVVAARAGGGGESNLKRAWVDWKTKETAPHHSLHVAHALAAGKRVSPEVLADYPHLAGKPTGNSKPQCPT